MERIENAALGRAVLDVADSDPEHFAMRDWIAEHSCGTVACLGGWTLIKAGYTYVQVEAEYGDYRFYRPDGTMVGALDDEARKLLGLTGDGTNEEGRQVAVFYDMRNGVDRFRKMVEEAEGRS